jgi:hypothetical protein
MYAAGALVACAGASVAHRDQQRPVEYREAADRAAEIGAVGAMLVGAHGLLERSLLLALGTEQLEHQCFATISASPP